MPEIIVRVKDKELKDATTSLNKFGNAAERVSDSTTKVRKDTDLLAQQYLVASIGVENARKKLESYEKSLNKLKKRSMDQRFELQSHREAYNEAVNVYKKVQREVNLLSSNFDKLSTKTSGAKKTMKTTGVVAEETGNTLTKLQLKLKSLGKYAVDVGKKEEKLNKTTEKLNRTEQKSIKNKEKLIKLESKHEAFYDRHTKQIKKVNNFYDKNGKLIAGVTKRQSMLNTAFGDFAIVMSGLAATFFVFQTIYSWINKIAESTKIWNESLEDVMAGTRALDLKAKSDKKAAALERLVGQMERRGFEEEKITKVINELNKNFGQKSTRFFTPVVLEMTQTDRVKISEAIRLIKEADEAKIAEVFAGVAIGADKAGRAVGGLASWFPKFSSFTKSIKEEFTGPDPDKYKKAMEYGKSWADHVIAVHKIISDPGVSLENLPYDDIIKRQKTLYQKMKVMGKEYREKLIADAKTTRDKMASIDRDKDKTAPDEWLKNRIAAINKMGNSYEIASLTLKTFISLNAKKLKVWKKEEAVSENSIKALDEYRKKLKLLQSVVMKFSGAGTSFSTIAKIMNVDEARAALAQFKAEYSEIMQSMSQAEKISDNFSGSDELTKLNDRLIELQETILKLLGLTKEAKILSEYLKEIRELEKTKNKGSGLEGFAAALKGIGEIEPKVGKTGYDMGITLRQGVEDGLGNLAITLGETFSTGDHQSAFRELGATMKTVFQQMAIQAMIAAIKMKAALAATGWGALVVAIGALYGELTKDTTDNSMKKLTKSMKSLEETIEDLNETIQKSWFDTFEAKGAHSSERYNIETSLAAFMKDDFLPVFEKYLNEVGGKKLRRQGADITAGGIEGIFDFFDENYLKIATDKVNNKVDFFEDIVGSFLEAVANTFKELRILAESILNDVRSFSDQFEFLDSGTTFEKTIKDFDTAVSKTFGDIEETLSSQGELNDIIAGIEHRIRLFQMSGNPSALVDKEEFMSYNWETGEKIFDEAGYNKAITNVAEDTASAVTVLVDSLVDLKAGLLTDEEIAELENWDPAAYEAKMYAYFADIRKGIISEMDDFVNDLYNIKGEVSDAFDSINDSFIAWYKALIDNGANMEELAYVTEQWARALKKGMQQPFESLLSKVQASATSMQRKDWELEDWLGRFDQITAEIESLDENSTGYWDKALELYEEQYDVLTSIYENAQKQLDEFRSLYKSLDDLLHELMGGDLASDVSASYYESRYKELFAAADRDAATPEDIEAFQNFVPDYLNFMKMFTTDYAGVVDKVLIDVRKIQSNIEDYITDFETALTVALDVESMDKLGDIYTVLSTKLQTIITEIGKLDFSVTINNIISGNTTTPPTPDEEDVIEPEPRTDEPGGAPNINPYIGINVDYGSNVAIGVNSLLGVLSDLSSEELAQYQDAMSKLSVLTSLSVNDIKTNLAQDLLSSSSGRSYAGVDGENHGYRINRIYSGDYQYLDSIYFYGAGGLASSMGIIGERGPEWAVPTYEPERTNFLRDVGVDSQKIGEEIAAQLVGIQATGGNGAPIHITIEIDGKQIGYVVADQVEKNSTLRKKIKKVN